METSDTVDYIDNEFGYKPNFGYNDKLLNYYNGRFNVDNENSINLNYVDVQNETKATNVCIVVPTYNEALNIPKLLNILFSEDQQSRYAKENIHMTVLVVDDNSPDGTANVVNEFQQTNSRIYLLSRKEKNGLGAAYIAGMHHAMNILNPDIIFEMDGDLSHGPEYVIPMIIKINEGADFVIGSRYVKGGSIPENWGFKRKLISRSANLYAKTILGIKNVNDCTGGFRAIRTSMLEQLDLNSLKTKGYAFQISLLEEMRRHNAIMSEVPIAFKDRTNGTSKMRMKDILEEGLFVLQASLQNMFYPKKIVKNTKNASLRVYTTVGHQVESISVHKLNKDQIAINRAVEFNQAFGLEEDPYEIKVAVN